MSLTIRELSNSKVERKEFINFPWKIYQDYENWVPPLKMDMHTLLNPDKHPFHQHADSQLFLAERNGEVVGRITAHVNHRHNEIWEDKVGFFGFFECIDEQEVADALFDAAGNIYAQETDPMCGVRLTGLPMKSADYSLMHSIYHQLS